MRTKAVKLFLRLALAAGFLSAVTDRFGLWPKAFSTWGNWDSFLAYTHTINPWLPSALVPTAGVLATLGEILFALCLLIGFKTEMFAKLSGWLLLVFALAMTFSTGIKFAFDYSVFAASAGAFALSTFKEKYLELDLLFTGKE